MSEMGQSERARMREEHRAIVQATMQAKRSGKIGKLPQNAGGEVVTAIVVVVSVLALLVLALRYGN